MADKNDKFKDNVPGKFYVDRECIVCSVCADAAPNNFRESDDGDHDICYKQPENEEELEEWRMSSHRFKKIVKGIPLGPHTTSH